MAVIHINKAPCTTHTPFQLNMDAPMTPSGLCSFCEALLREKTPSPGQIAYHPTVGDIKESGKSCQLCSYILDGSNFASIQARTPELTDEVAKTLPFTIDIKRAHVQPSGIVWLRFETALKFRPKKITYVYGKEFSITVCHSQGMPHVHTSRTE